MAWEHRPRLVVMDVRLNGAVDGIDVALAIHQKVGSKVITVTGSKEPASLERIKQGHAVAVLFKPLQSGKLENVVSLALS